MPKLEDRTPTKKALGSTPDILQYCQFDWYEQEEMLGALARSGGKLHQPYGVRGA
jgi:hypothetical protein